MFIHTPKYGSVDDSKLALMGIRFAELGGTGEGAGGEASSEGGESDTGSEESKFAPPQSQADLDRIIESRLRREREKYSDYDQLKAAKAEYDKHLESTKSEQQKALDAAKAEASTEVTQRFLSRLVSTEVKSIAAAAGFNDPSDALQVLTGELPVKGDEPDVDALKALVDELAKKKPYLLKEPTKSAPAGRPKPKQGDPVDGSGTPGKGKAAAALRQLAAQKRGA